MVLTGPAQGSLCQRRILVLRVRLKAPWQGEAPSLSWLGDAVGSDPPASSERVEIDASHVSRIGNRNSMVVHAAIQL
jgi:hypothetical protein